MGHLHNRHSNEDVWRKGVCVRAHSSYARSWVWLMKLFNRTRTGGEVGPTGDLYVLVIPTMYGNDPCHSTSSNV